MNKKDEIIKRIIELFKKDGITVTKIFWNSKNGIALVFGNPKNKLDGMYLVEKVIKQYKLFAPTENFKLYGNMTQDKNLIYERT